MKVREGVMRSTQTAYPRKPKKPISLTFEGTHIIAGGVALKGETPPRSLKPRVFGCF